MNTETNRFENLTEEDLRKIAETTGPNTNLPFKAVPKAPKYIEFKIGEKCVIKGYYFMIESINVESNRMILAPVGLQIQRRD